MPKKKEKEEESVFYVGVRDPVEIRRSLLESSKEMIQYLQRAEKFKSVRKEKTKLISKLKEDTKEITKLIKKLKRDLPKTGLRAQMHKQEEAKQVKKEMAKTKELEEKAKKSEKKAPKKEKPKEEKAPKEMTELEKLEKELSTIESRLTKLS